MSAFSDDYALAGKRVWVAGHRGMVGGAICRRLEQENPAAILTASHNDLDLTDQTAVRGWVDREKPDCVFVAAAKVGGIYANNTLPADFLYDNIMIEGNVLKSCLDVGVGKLLFLGSSCIYPKMAPQPLTEDSLLTGPLEPTNQWYAIAKIAGIKMCEAFRLQYGARFISAMPTNLYGPGDNYHPEYSHVPAALIRRFHEAKQAQKPQVEVWGTGQVRREFMHVGDLADGLVFLMKHYDQLEFVNIGTGTDVTIEEFANLVKQTVGYDGTLIFDHTRPDGTPRKVMDVSRLAEAGWTSRIALPAGLADAYDWFLRNVA